MSLNLDIRLLHITIVIPGYLFNQVKIISNGNIDQYIQNVIQKDIELNNNSNFTYKTRKKAL